MSKIQWTEETWNPIAGCSKKSDGCRNCYAIPMAHRLEAMAIGLDNQGKNSGRIANYKGLTEKRGDRLEWTGAVRFIPEALQIPLKRKKPTIYFVNSMSDIGHDLVQDEWLDQIFAVMALTPQHQYQILTKRPERLVKYLCSDIDCDNRIEAWGSAGFELTGEYERFEEPLKNVWIGISAENQKAWNERSPFLNAIARIGWKTMISFEPLLEAINIRDFNVGAMYLAGFDSEGSGNGLESGCFFLNDCWAIIGGESGHGSRHFSVYWAINMINQLEQAKIPVFVKQLGSNHDWKNKCGKKGDEFESFPESLKIREMPEAS